jgi:hypothetical protein
MLAHFGYLPGFHSPVLGGILIYAQAVDSDMLKTKPVSD